MRLTDETETQLFRIAQEALTNVARHSKATEVAITLRHEGGKARLRISDNGRGLPQPRATGGIGMTAMRARARGAGGELEILPAADGKTGLTIEAWVPAEPVRNEQEDSNLVGR
jgi:signal transduction histidine kinase